MFPPLSARPRFARLSLILCVSILLFWAAETVTAAPPTHDKKVILYYPDWRNGPDISAYADRLTHLQYAFIDLEADGTCEPAGSNATINELQSIQANFPHISVLLSVGGWTWSDNFPAVAADPALRAHMIDTCMALSRGYGFDGIDLDWEHPVVGGEPDTPGSSADIDNYVTLLNEFRAAMTADEELSIALGAATSIYNPFDLAALSAPLDSLNIMTYDMAGGWTPNAYHHTPLYDSPLSTISMSSDKAVQDLINGGVPSEKIVMGVAFYGRGWYGTADGGTNGVGQPGGTAYESSYDNIISWIGTNGYQRYWDDIAKSPYLYSPTLNGGAFISYDDPQSMCEKAQYALDNNLGGVMGWEITQNLSNDDLMAAIDTCLHDSSVTPTHTPTPSAATATPTLTPTPAPTQTMTPSSTGSPTATPDTTGPSLIGTNGDFSAGTSQWYIVGATADGSSGAGCVDVTDPGTFAWDVIFGSTNRINIENNRTYRVTFDAWADDPTQINVVWAYGQAPWTTYLLDSVMVSTAQSYQFDFTMTEPTDPVSVFAFQLGAQAATTVCFDNVVLTETGTPIPTATSTLPTATPTMTPTPIPANQQCDVTIAPWPGNAKSAVSLTFDDGYMSQYTYARPLLDSYSFPATFFIAAGVTGGNYMTWTEINELAADGHEIGAHTMSHPHLPQLDEGDDNIPGTIRWQLAESNRQIAANVPASVPIISFAYPFADFNADVRTITMEYYEAARSVTGIPTMFNSASPTTDQWSRLASYEPYFVSPRSTAGEAAVLLEAQQWIDAVVAAGGWGVMDGHSVVPFSGVETDGSWQPIASEWLDDWFGSINTHVANGDIWMATMGDATRYIKERDNVACVLLEDTAAQQTYLFTDPLDDTIYDHALTTLFPMPATWTNISVSQGGQTLPHTIVTENGMQYIAADIVPDAGDVMLASSNAVPTAVTLQTQEAAPIWTMLLIVTMAAVCVGTFLLVTNHE